MSDRCAACGKRILFTRTQRGKWLPVDWDSVSSTTLLEHADGRTAPAYDPKTMKAHFATCPQADFFRKRRPRGSD